MQSTPKSGHDGPYDAPICIGRMKVLNEWIDYNGHMNAAYYGFTIQKYAEAFLEDTVGFGTSFVKAENKGPFVLQNHLNYVSELKLDERIRIDMRLLDHDNKRMHMFFEMVSEDSGKVSATAEYLNMNVDLTARRATDFPDWLKARLATMQENHSNMPRPAQVAKPIGLRR